MFRVAFTFCETVGVLVLDSVGGVHGGQLDGLFLGVTTAFFCIERSNFNVLRKQSEVSRTAMAPLCLRSWWPFAGAIVQ